MAVKPCDELFDHDQLPNSGIAQIFLLGIKGSAFTLQAFLAGALFNALPGILLQLLLIPLIVRALSASINLQK